MKKMIINWWIFHIYESLPWGTYVVPMYYAASDYRRMTMVKGMSWEYHWGLKHVFDHETWRLIFQYYHSPVPL